MVKKRSLLAGMTDYTGVSFDDILLHLGDWRDLTAQTITTLQRLREEVEKYSDRLDYPEHVRDYINYFADLFTRYLNDFERLVTESRHSVTNSHLEIVEQLCTSSSHEEHICIQFRRDHIHRSIKDESLRYLVDEIYRETRGLLVDYKDLGNLLLRLRTFVGATPSPSPFFKDSEILELKPNFFGLGLNLNHVIKRVTEWWKRRRKALKRCAE